jgi:cation:H+ antiporter
MRVQAQMVCSGASVAVFAGVGLQRQGSHALKERKSHWYNMIRFFQTLEIKKYISVLDILDPWLSLAIFFTASFLMIWRLGSLETKGLEGTVLGTLIMPYCSGLSNLIFAYVLGRSGGSGSMVLENCIVNNVTNLTLLIGLPAVFWRMHIIPAKMKKMGPSIYYDYHRLNYLSLLLSLVALMFFTGVVWALGRDGKLDFSDGLVLVGMFFFWQVFQVFDVLKTNVHESRSLSWSMLIDLLFIIVGGYFVYISVDRLVAWVPKAGSGFFVLDNLGWLSGFLMVLPNSLLAIYYSIKGRPDIVYTSQTGDAHICIPMCIGLFALFHTIQIPSFFNLGVMLLLGAGLVHFVFVTFLGRLPRFMGLALTGTYYFFLYKGLIKP